MKVENEKLKANSSKNTIAVKSFDFALAIVKTAKTISSIHNEFVLSKQVLRSGTTIGAMVREAEHAESKADFIHKMSVALKEANETRYWLDLLVASGYLNKQEHTSLGNAIEEIIKLCAAIVKSAKSNIK